MIRKPRRAALELIAGAARPLSDDFGLVALCFMAGFGTGQRVEVSVDTVTAFVAALEDASTRARDTLRGSR